MRIAGWIGKMRIGSRRAVGLAIVAASLAYLCYPYVALYRLGHALQRGDVPTLMSNIDWDSVRSGIATDVAAELTGTPVAATPAADELPAFGMSFASDLAHTEVNARLTPDALAARLTDVGSSRQRGDMDAAHLHWAFFSSPTCFIAELSTQQGSPVRLQMDLEGAKWILTRAWLPPDLLTQPHRT